MARIPYADLDKAPDNVKQLLQTLRNPGGNIFRLLLNAGAVTGPYLEFGAVLRNTLAIDLLLYEMIIVRVANLSKSGYVIRQHENFLRKHKVSEDSILALRTRLSLGNFSEQELAVLQLTDEVVLNVRASEATVAEAAKHFSPEALLHIMLTIGLYMMTCRMLETFDVELQPSPAVP